MMADDKQVLIGADPNPASAEGFAPAAGLKRWVTPKVITSLLGEGTEGPARGSASDGHAPPANWS